MSRLSYVLLTAVVIAGALLATPVQAKLFRFEETREFPVKEGFKLTVANTSGLIAVTAKPSDQVVIHIIKEIDASSRQKAEEIEDEIEVEIDAADDRIDIEARYPQPENARGFLEELFSLGKGFPGDVSFEIEVPVSVNIRATSTSGDIEIDGVSGELHADATSGTVMVTEFTGDCDIETTSGDIQLKDVKGNVDVSATSSDVLLENITGDVELNATSGDTELHWVAGTINITKTSGEVLAEKCSGDFDIKSTSGDILLDQRDGAIFIATTSGNVTVTSEFTTGKRFEIGTISGDIRVKAPSEIKGDIRIETVSGNIDTDLALEVSSLNRKKIQGRIGGGGATIDLSSTSGNIVLEEF